MRGIELESSFHRQLRFFKQRKGHTDLKRGIVLQIEKMVAAPHRLIGNGSFFENGGKLQVQARVVAMPELTVGIFVRIARHSRSTRSSEPSVERRPAGFGPMHERNVAVRANAEPLAIFGLALRTNHPTGPVTRRG